ncbi:MAG: carbohydrate kinase family protein [Armatimonadota bacterium]
MLLGYGLVNLDDIAIVNNLVLDGKATADNTLVQVGGPVPVALQTYTRLGGTTFFCGVTGDDSSGDYITNHLRESITDSFLNVCPTGTSSRSIVIIERSTGARTIVNIPASVTSQNDVSHLTTRLSPGAILHLDGRDLETNLILAGAARQAGALVSIDLGTMRPGREALLAQCDIILASKSGSAGLTPEYPDDIERQLAVMREFGARIVGVTLAERGVVVGDKTNTYRMPAFHVDNVVDTNGAGDCFHGAFLYAYKHLYDNLEDVTRFAQASVALKITALGNDAGLPRRSQVIDYLGSV